jgi:hypothetical protein
MNPHVGGLQGRINDRQRELHNVTTILSKQAARRAIFSVYAKGTIILLGAFAATKGAADQILGSSSNVSLLLYTLVGLLIAAIAGLETAFKNEATAAELKLLAAAGQATVREVDTRWQRDFGVGGSNDPVSAALSLIELQDARLTDIQEKAAKLGVNIALEVRELSRGQEIYTA